MPRSFQKHPVDLCAQQSLNKSCDISYLKDLVAYETPHRGHVHLQSHLMTVELLIVLIAKVNALEAPVHKSTQ